MAARAIRESLDHRGVPNVVMDLLDFSSDLFKWSYSDVYAFVSEHSHLPAASCTTSRTKTGRRARPQAFRKDLHRNVKKFMRYISENEPRKCICTHYFPRTSSPA